MAAEAGASDRRTLVEPAQDDGFSRSLVQNEALGVGDVPSLAAEPTRRSGPVSPGDLARSAGQDRWSFFYRHNHDREFRRHAR